MAGIAGAPKGGAYAAAKHAVVGLTKTAAVEYARANIRINAVCPFFSMTDIVRNSNVADAQSEQELSEYLARGCPMKRLGEPQEIVNVMLMLISPANSYMTGQAIAVDGGVSAI